MSARLANNEGGVALDYLARPVGPRWFRGELYILGYALETADVFDDFFVGHRCIDDGILHEPQEQQATMSRGPPVEAKDKYIIEINRNGKRVS